jgi:hypothetical protein
MFPAHLKFYLFSQRVSIASKAVPTINNLFIYMSFELGAKIVYKTELQSSNSKLSQYFSFLLIIKASIESTFAWRP